MIFVIYSFIYRKWRKKNLMKGLLQNRYKGKDYWFVLFRVCLVYRPFFVIIVDKSFLRNVRAINDILRRIVWRSSPITTMMIVLVVVMVLVLSVFVIDHFRWLMVLFKINPEFGCVHDEAYNCDYEEFYLQMRRDKLKE